MTDPTEQLAAVRRGLDAAAQQAKAADFGVWVPDHVPDRGAWDFIHAWSPARVLAVVGSLRLICDGIEAQLADHGPDEVTGNCAGWGHASFAMRPENCWDRKRALSVIAGLAAVWAPTEEEAEK